MRRPEPARAPASPRARAEAGSMLLAVVFFLVAGGALAAAVLSIGRTQAGAGALDVQGVRAYWAARSALEWGSFQVLDPNNSQGLAPDQLPACFASPKVLVLPADLAAFTVSLTCQRFPALGSHEEQQNRLAGYLLVATATQGTVGSPDRVARVLESRVVKCKAPVTGVAPDYGC